MTKEASVYRAARSLADALTDAVTAGGRRRNIKAMLADGYTLLEAEEALDAPDEILAEDLARSRAQATQAILDASAELAAGGPAPRKRTADAIGTVQ